MATIGGGTIKEFNSSQAWGVNPSAADGVVVVDEGDSFVIAVGDYVVYSFDGIGSFAGIVSEARENVNFEAGREYSFQVVDNRIRLMWQTVFGAWNIEDPVFDRIHARPDAPSTGENDNSTTGGDGAGIGDDPSDTPDEYDVTAGEPPATPWTVRRRWKHILPEHWAAGTATYTDQPLTVREILNSAFNHSWGQWGFSRTYHSAQNAIVTGIDHTTGVKLGNLISEMNQKTGLDVRISGQRTLVWGRKGEGLVPVPDSTCDQWGDGLAVGSTDTRIRVVGEPVRVQKLNIELEPDWKQDWEEFIDELAWLRSVAEEFEMPTATKADWADVAAFARTVTVAEYAKEADFEAMMDGRMFGKVARNDLPAWTYINELVYRSYRIPEDFTLYGVPLDSLEIADGLLCDTAMDNAGENTQQIYPEENPEFYPPVQASAIVKGQPLDLINARDIAMFYRNAGNNLSTEWTEAPEFEVDTAGKSMRFRTPIFIDGEGEKSIYLLPNRGEGGGIDLSGSDATADYLDVAVPNPDFEIEPAQIKACFTFLLGRFHRDYGSGPRHGSVHHGALDLHLLDTTDLPSVTSDGLGAVDNSKLSLPQIEGATFSEILYEDGQSAFAKADAIGSPLVELPQTLRTGGFTRNGSSGSMLTTSTDRVTVNVSFGSAVTERVEFTRGNTSQAEFPERSLQRIQRLGELFPGQESLRKEARQLRQIAKLERSAPSRRARSHTSFRDVFEKPVGGEVASTTRVTSAIERTWQAGDIVWLDKDGKVASVGGVFGGIVVAATTGKQVHICCSGRVPVKVSGNIPVNSVVMGSPGSSVGTCLGQCGIGRLTHGKSLPESGTVLAYLDVSAPGPDCRFRMYFDYHEQKLFIGPGTVGVIEEGTLVRPISPTLDMASLETTPYWDISEKGDGAWLIAVRIRQDPSAANGGGAQCDMKMVRDESDLGLGPMGIAWLIGTVVFTISEGKRVLAGFDQRWWSDIPVKFDDPGSGGEIFSDSSSEDSSYPSYPSEGSGSSKDTAIVRASWTKDGCTALHAIESPDVRFVDWCGDFKLTSRVTRVKIDPRFVEVCAPRTLRVFGLAASAPWPVGVTVDQDAGEMVFTAWPLLRPHSVSVTLVGTRKGQAGLRFPNKTWRDYKVNERRLNLFKNRSHHKH